MERNELWLNTAVALASDSTGDKAVMRVPGGQFDIVQFEVTFEGTSTNATLAVIALDRRVKAGTDTNRVEVTTITKLVTSCQGYCFYAIPTTATTVDAGEELVVEVTTANGDACAFSAGVKLRERPEARAALTYMVASA